ncbi:MAG: PAS domain S-box-containing protein [Candidatus Latescibacterota bacterium]
MNKSSLAKVAIITTLFAAGFCGSLYGGFRLREQAREIWISQAQQDAERITETAQSWLSLTQAQLRGISAVFYSSQSVNEDELLDALYIIESTETAIPLTSVAFVAAEEDGMRHVLLSTDVDGPLAPGSNLDEVPALRSTLNLSEQIGENVIMGSSFTLQDPKRRYVMLAFAAPNDDRDGHLVTLVDLTAFFSGLHTLHIPPGLELQLVEQEAISPKMTNRIISGPTAAPLQTEHKFSIRTDSGHNSWEFCWYVLPAYDDGPDAQLAEVVQWAGIALTLLSALLVGYLMQGNRREQEKFRTVFNSSLDGYLFFDSEKGIIDCNAAAVELFGYGDKSDLLGKKMHDVSPEFQPDGSSSQERRQEIIAAVERDGFHRYEWVLQRLDGRDFPTEITIRPVQLGNDPALLAVLHDLSARKEAEDALIRSEEELRQTIDSMPVPIAIVNLQEARIVYVNQASVDYHGIERDAFASIPSSDVYARAEDRQIVLAEMQAKGRVEQLEIQIRRLGDGDVRWVLFSIYPSRFQGQAVSIVGLYDITERKRNELQRNALQLLRDAIWTMRDHDDLDDLVRAMRASLEELELPFRNYGINVVDEKSGSPTVYAHSALATGEVRHNPGVGNENSTVTEIWRAGKTAYRRDLREEDQQEENTDIPRSFIDEVRSVVDVPFSHGTLAVNSTQAHAFSPWHIAALEEFSEVLSEGFRRLDDLRALADSERRLNLAMETSGVGLWEIDLQSGVAYFDKQWMGMLGYEQPAFEHTYAAWVDLLHPDDAEETQGAFREFLTHAVDHEEEQFFDLEFRMRHKDGTYRWILARGGIVERDEKNQPRLLIGTHVNISERKLREQHQAAQQRVRETIWKLTSTAEFTTVVDAIKDSLDSLQLPYNALGISAVDNRENPTAIIISDQQSQRRIVPIDDANPWTFNIVEFWRGQKVLYRPDLQQDDPYDERRYFSEQIHAVLDVPFSHGTLALNSTEANCFTPSHIQALSDFSDVLSEAFRRLDDLRTLEERQHFLEGVINNSTALIYAKDLEGHYFLVNDHWTEILDLGLSREEMIGKTDYDLFPAQVAENLRANDHRVLQADEFISEKETVEVGGQPHTYISIKFPLRDADGQAYGICGISTDITDINNAQEELSLAKDEAERSQAEAEEAARQAEEARSTAEAANRSKSVFLANMSHEIRTPMNAILGFSEILAGLVADPQQKQYLNSIQTSGRSLLTLINDILDLSKVEAGKLELEIRPTDAHAVFNDMVAIFSQKVSEQGLGFLIEIDASVPQALELDEVRLRQILINLIGNAVKFTKKGHVRLFIRAVPDAENERQIDLYIDVEDTGIGIAIAEQNKIFGAFEQQTGQSINEYGGTGLGLAITRKLVEMMDGEISVDSTESKGSTFHVHLRGISLAATEARRMPVDAPDLETLSFASAKILVADDVAANRELVKGFLARYADLQLIEAEDGQQAIEACQKHMPDLVLMDIKMPVLDGYTATQRLKANERTRHIPVVALTASTMRETEEELSRVCEAFLKNPVGQIELVQTIARFIEHSLGRDEASAEADTPSAPPSDPLNIAEEVLERLPQLMAILEEETQTWEELCTTLTINEIESFAEHLQAIGKEHAYHPLVQWAETLAEQTTLFDMDGVQKTLGEFVHIGEEIRQHLAAQDA